MAMDDFIFVSSISRWEVAHARLLASPCLQGGGERLVLQVNADSAAAAVNMVLESRPRARWQARQPLHDPFLPRPHPDPVPQNHRPRPLRRIRIPTRRPVRGLTPVSRRDSKSLLGRPGKNPVSGPGGRRAPEPLRGRPRPAPALYSRSSGPFCRPRTASAAYLARRSTRRGAPCDPGSTED